MWRKDKYIQSFLLPNFVIQINYGRINFTLAILIDLFIISWKVYSCLHKKLTVNWGTFLSLVIVNYCSNDLLKNLN